MSSEAGKLKCIYVAAAWCVKSASSSEGVKRLIALGTNKMRNKNPNKGLCPKTYKHRASSSSSDGCYPSFSKASKYHVKQIRTEPTHKKKKKEISSKNNKRTDYLLKTESSGCDISVDCRETTTSEGSPNPSVSEFSNNICCVKSKSLQGSSESKKQKVSNYFGLFGAAETDEYPEPDYFNQLPLEVMENIFCQLPFLDLRNCRLVCHLWNDVINSKRFIPWKTVYYELKYGYSLAAETMAFFLALLEGNTPDHCLHALVRFMKAGFTRVPAPDMLEKLKKHKKFDVAESVLKERFPDWEENISPWCFITTIILLSEAVSDIFEIIHLLGYTVDVLEALYCNATFLLYCMNTLKINHGLHYRVYYALYTYENQLPAEIGNSSVQNNVSSGQQNMHNYCSSLHLTSEQNRIVRHKLKQGDVIKVIGFAGSGKTSTLIELARRNPNLRFLNVTFNESACDHAQKLFPSNVKFRTVDSLAFASKGKQFVQRLASKFSLYIIRQCLNVSECTFERRSYCRAVVLTIKNFMVSDDMEISVKHIPKDKPITPQMMDRFSTITHKQKHHICESAAAVWKVLTDRNEKCPVTRDVYLKMFQMSKPVIKKYDCIMMDEAQDCNPVVLDIVLSQKVPVILVGDPHQKIYGFHGNKTVPQDIKGTHTLQDIKSTHTYRLNKSFRCGPEIAYVASCWLEVLKKYRRETLVGNSRPSTLSGGVTGQYAIIARTKLGLFKEAIRLCCKECYKPEEEPHFPIHGAFIGGLHAYGLDQMEDIYRLAALTSGMRRFIIGKPQDLPPPQDEFVKRFKTFLSLLTYARKRKDDTELNFKVDLVLKHAYKIPEYIATLRRKCSTELELANVVFTTVDKAKGFEFDTVRLVDDYEHPDKTFADTVSEKSEEEWNMVYVALTRAKSSIFITQNLYCILLYGQEKFEYPVPSKDIVQNVVTQNCFLCFTPLEPHTVLSLVRRKVILVNCPRTLKHGPMCIKCATTRHYTSEIDKYLFLEYYYPLKDFAHRSLKFLVGSPAFQPTNV